MAALLVLVYHLGFWIWRDPGYRGDFPKAYLPLSPFFSKGWVGVEIFFVLSGFVIAYSTAGTTALRFLRHRALRLLPAAFLCSTFTAAALLTAYPIDVVGRQWLRSIVLFPAGPWVDGSYWTLPIEVAFYLLILLNLPFLNGRFIPISVALLGVLSTMVCLCKVWVPGWLPPPVMVFLTKSSFPPYACLLLVHGAFFALGVFLFLLLMQRATAWRVVVVVICAAGCVAELIWHDRDAAFASRTQAGPGLPLALWMSAVLALVLAVRLNEFLQTRLGQGGTRTVRQLGLATYPLYLLHAKIGQVAIGGLHRRIGYGPALFISSVSVCVLAVFVSQVLEPVVRGVLDRLWRV